MANQLKMAKVHSIQTLHACGWSQRRIARELGVHRETVARYVQMFHVPRISDLEAFLIGNFSSANCSRSRWIPATVRRRTSTDSFLSGL